jgi:hypothetical protein
MKDSIFSFSVLQYRHDPWIGEALNVGVLLSSNVHGFLKMKVRTASPRLSQAYPSLNAPAFRGVVRSMESQVMAIANRYERDGKSLAANFKGHDFGSGVPSSGDVAISILPDDDSALRWRPQGVGSSSNRELELERLFRRYVAHWDADSGRDVRTDEDVFSVFHQALRKSPKNVDLEEKIIHTPRFGELKFKHTFRNGSLHIVQPLSFDAANADTLFAKAAKWSGMLSRLQDNENIKPYFVTGAPSSPALNYAYLSALDLLRGAVASPTVVDEKQSALIVEALVSASGS